MKTSYAELPVDYLDFTDVEVRIANRSDALALLKDLIEAGTVERTDIPLQALRDAIERGII